MEIGKQGDEERAKGALPYHHQESRIGGQHRRQWRSLRASRLDTQARAECSSPVSEQMHKTIEAIGIEEESYENQYA